MERRLVEEPHYRMLRYVQASTHPERARIVREALRLMQARVRDLRFTIRAYIREVEAWPPYAKE